MTGKYEEEVLAWRQKQDDNLRKPNGWLALAGLFWLREGDNPIGSGPGNAIVLPAGKAPDMLGTLSQTNGGVRLAVRAASPVRVNGEQTTQAELLPDSSEAPSLVETGDLAFMIIERSGLLAVRLWDNSQPAREQFAGRIWFPLQPDYRLTGRYRRFVTPEKMLLPRTLGDAEEMQVDGAVRFNLLGQENELVCTELEGGDLWVLFKDATSGQETYPAGRYLVVKRDKEDEVVVDFNKAYNPPCAFTPYATCLLPPAQNWLTGRVLAGERYVAG